MSRRPIRVLHFINSLGLGGAEKRLTEIVEGLPRENFEFHVCCLSATGPYESRVRAAGANMDVLGYRRMREDGRLKAARIFEPWRMIRRFRDMVDRVRPEVVHTWIPVCNIYGALALHPRRYRAIRLIASRVFTGEYRASNRLVARQEDLTLSRVDVVYCNSEAVRDDALRRQKGLEREKTVVIRNGVDVGRFERKTDRRAAARAALGLSDDKFVVLTIAALRPHKGHVILLRAARRVIEQAPNARFLLAGPDQGEGEKLRAVCRELDIESAVHFLGPREDAPALYAAADLFVLPSFQEGLPNVLLEAQSAGAPCVATDLPGCREALGGGSTGVLVPAGKDVALTDAMLGLMNNRDWRERLAISGRLNVQSHFGQAAMLRGFAELYENESGRTRTSPV